MANTYLKRTLSGTPSTYTFSAWIKLGNLVTATNTYQSIFSNGTQQILGIYGGGNSAGWNALYHYNGSSTWYSTELLRDPCCWYHVLVKVSSGTGTTYINGNQVTYGTTYSFINLVSTADKTTIGCYANNIDSFFTGSMSHVHFCDGTAYNPTEFGETDATTGEWKIKTSPNVNYGTDGFFILKDGNSVTDQSGNSNNFTVGGGTLTKTEDNPSNVFCTLNPLVYTPNPPTFSNGNTKFVKSTTGIGHGSDTIGTLGAKSGKYYFEMKTVTSTSFYVGIIGNNHNNANSNGDIGGSNIHTVNPDNTYGDNVNNNGTTTSITLSYSANDIFGLAFDLDNGKWYFHINGTYFNSGDPTSGSTGTGSMGNITTGELFYLPFAGGGSYNHQHTFEFNFGNGYFGSTQISSAGTNASGIGIFEYDVPTGYTALSTKGLNL